VATKITSIGVRVQEMHHIEVDPEDEDELQRDPAAFLKKALEAQGHTVNRIHGTREELLEAIRPARTAMARRGGWFHTVYDRNNPADVCNWHWYYY
jgi:hypothetical protein